MSGSGDGGGNIGPEWAIRDAVTADVEQIRAFGHAHIGLHYSPLIGADAADQQISNWWNESHIRSAVARGLVLVAEAEGEVIGVAQRGWNGADHVLYKLYLDPDHRGRGIGPALVDAVIQRLPPRSARLAVEHFAGNARAAAFYERERFFLERVEKHYENAALDVVWRARALIAAIQDRCVIARSSTRAG